ncbi:hypothetical protein SBA4_20056 [Candidatus Sulfopaludibacter sp. SbA4]|nr:hypothetical protein SBA4_20056 [Candidatus Sulfopaludibacter sp. SbA4]
MYGTGENFARANMYYHEIAELTARIVRRNGLTFWRGRLRGMIEGY